MALEISLRYIDSRTAVVTLVGALTLGTGLKTADQRIQTAIEEGVSKLAIDMTGVPYSDSAGLGVLIHTFGLTRVRNGALRLSGASERMLSMLNLTRINTLLPVDPDVEASLAAMR